MDEQLQNKIALALDKMMNGAPEVWQALIAEVQLRGTVMAGLCVIFIVLGLMLIKKAFKIDQWDDLSCAWAFSGTIMVTVGTISALSNIYNILAPSLTLLDTLT